MKDNFSMSKKVHSRSFTYTDVFKASINCFHSYHTYFLQCMVNLCLFATRVAVSSAAGQFVPTMHWFLPILAKFQTSFTRHLLKVFSSKWKINTNFVKVKEQCVTREPCYGKYFNFQLPLCGIGYQICFSKLFSMFKSKMVYKFADKNIYFIPNYNR